MICDIFRMCTYLKQIIIGYMELVLDLLTLASIISEANSSDIELWCDFLYVTVF